MRACVACVRGWALRRRSRRWLTSLARIFYTVMRYGVAYQKKSEEEFVNEHQKRMEQNLHRRAKELGYELVKIEVPKDEVAASA